MKTRTPTPRLRRFHPTAALALLLAGLPCLPLSAQVSFSGETYLQNFNTLPGTTTAGNVDPFTFANNSTLAGWWSTEGGDESARASNGSRNGGTLYSWGPNNSADRALGLFAGDGYPGGHTAYLGLQLFNATGATIESVTLTFDVEQWRRHTNNSSWGFSWLVTGATGDQLTAAGYTSDTRGNASSLHVGTSGGIGGNNAENRYAVSFTLTSLDWQAGEYLWLRWDSTQGNNASGIGLDNFSLEAVPIPEPAQMVFGFGILTLASVLGSRRRK